MLNINTSDFIYTGRIHIFDPDGLTDIAKKHMIKDFYMVFAKDMSKEFIKKFTSKNIRLATNTDNFAFFRDESNCTYNGGSRTIYNNNLCMYTVFSYKDLINIIGYIFNSMDITISCDFDYDHDMIFKEDANDAANQLYKCESQTKLNQIYAEMSKSICLDVSSIKNNDVTLRIKRLEILQTNVDYVTSLSNYELFTEYMLKASKTFKNSLQIKTNVSDISVLLMPTSDCGDYPVANIVKMFNVIQLQHNKNMNISKAYIHSQDLDKYMNNPRPMCYVRCEERTASSFKNVTITQNTYTMFIGEQFNECYVLNSISVYKYGGIMFNYYISSSDEAIDTIYDTIRKKTIEYFKNTIVKYISISDFYNSPHYNPTNYSLAICNISGSVIINNATYSMLEDTIELMRYKPNIKMSYKTKTSCEISMMCDKSLYLEHGLQCLYVLKGMMTKDAFVNAYATRVHIGYVNSSIVINIKNCFSYDLYMLHIALIIFSMSHFNKKADFIQSTSSNAVINIKELAKFAISYPKENLKRLQKEDPELFGRRVDVTNKTYSNLCQKPEQRPVIINKATYEKYVADEATKASVIAMDNQTYSDKVLYLMCVDDKFTILNFHSIPNQKCIVRCTTQFSNKAQYDICAKSFNVKGFKTSTIKNENQMIVRYNPLLTVGRKCTLPPELGVVYTDFILSSFETITTENILNKCKQLFGAQPFIMERNEREGYYSILTSSIDFTKDTVLLLTSTVRPNVYFYLISVSDYNRWFNLKYFPEFTQLITTENNLRSEAFDIFFGYITKIVPELKSYDYFKQKASIDEYFNDLINMFGITYVVSNTDKEIVGIITKNKIFYSTPRYIYGSDITIELHNDKLNMVISRIENGMYKLPSFDSFSYLNDEITTYYKDQTTGMIVMINILDYDLLIEPIPVPKYYYGHDIVTIDFEAMKRTLKEYKRKLIVKQNLQKQQTEAKNANALQLKITNMQEDDDYVYFDVITHFVFLCYYENVAITYENVKKIIQKYKLFTNDASSLTYIGASDNKTISWTRSKISESVLKHFFKYYESNNMYIFIKLITNLLRLEYEFPKNNTDIIYCRIVSV